MVFTFEINSCNPQSSWRTRSSSLMTDSNIGFSLAKLETILISVTYIYWPRPPTFVFILSTQRIVCRLFFSASTFSPFTISQNRIHHVSFFFSSIYQDILFIIILVIWGYCKQITRGCESEKANTSFLQFWGMGYPRSRSWSDYFLVKYFLLVCRQPPSHCILI